LIAWRLTVCAVVFVLRAGESWSRPGDRDTTITVLAFGDVNLGRSVGQELLRGRFEYPFKLVKQRLEAADVVFVNLESPLSDQGGETQHPKDNLIFCGPPEGARSLKWAGVTVVSTANNHAFDYGLKGLKETIDFLEDQRIAFVGTSRSEEEVFAPRVIEHNGIRLAVLAYTQFVNQQGEWKGRISLYDELRARKEIDLARRQAEFVIISFHGGREYVDLPPEATLRQMRWFIDAGADAVWGHHPHVPQGIELYKGKLLFYSLGNFVFYQPQHEWTQRSFGVKMAFGKSSGRVMVRSVQILPIRAGKQPEFLERGEEADIIVERIRALSNVPLVAENGGYFVRLEKID
jgi:poly-gamma-glutamate synthesis protein (capsule biosynthesis protein)